MLIKHISIRVAWHDNKWNGSICNHPTENSFCINLPRIYELKDDDAEDKIKSKEWCNLTPEQLPPRQIGKRN